MNSPIDTPTATTASRRGFLQTTGTLAAAATALQSTGYGAFADEDNEIRVAMVGCGGRGSGACFQALSVEGQGPVKLVALADVFDQRISNVYNSVTAAVEKGQLQGTIDVPEERRFVSFDAYKLAMDCLRPGDIVILTTPPAFRWLHYTYAIEKGLNVFMEKPVTVDAPTSLRMLELNKQAIEKNLKVGVGLMCRHCDARRELFDRIQNGEIGDLNMIRAYRMAGPTGSAEVPPRGDDSSELSELMYQIKHFHGFLWLSGGAVNDFLIHNIDEGCWMKNDYPVEVVASGGRHYRGDAIDQNFDVYSMEYTFADGTKLFVGGRTMPGCYSDFATYAHGSKGLAVVSTAGHVPAKPRIYKGHNEDEANLLWAFPQPEKNPYQLEWDHLIAAIRNDEKYNEVERGTMSSLTASMGRMAAHTGQKITREEFLACDHEFAPSLPELTLDGDAPLMADSAGKYPIPYPGLIKDREYGA